MRKDSPARLEGIDDKFYKFLKIEFLRLKREEHLRLNDELKILWGKKIKFIDGVLRALDSSFSALLKTDETKDYDSQYAKAYKEFNLNALILSWFKKPVSNVSNFKLISSDDYSPPLDPIIILSHLYTVSNFYVLAYKFIPHIPFNLVSKVEYASLVLVKLATFFTLFAKERGKKFHRVAKSKIRVAFKKAARKQLVLEEFYRLDKRTELKPHQIAVRIRDQLQHWGKTAPHTDTIKTYLREEKLI